MGESYNTILERMNNRENRKLLFSLAGAAFVLTAVVVATFSLLNQSQDLRQRASDSANIVVVSAGKLYINGNPFTIRAVNYNPTPIGSSTIDTTAPFADIPKIAQLGANTIATYFIGRADFDQWFDLTTGVNFYNNLYPAAESNNMKLILGYYSNEHENWTDATQVARITKQYQDMVAAAKDRPSTLVYMIGNEVFEKLANETQKTAYAQWIGNMVNWTHTFDPNHPVMYSDIANYTGLPYLKQYAPSLDIYGINHYAFATTADLNNLFAQDVSLWPGKAIMLHEWGSDAYNVNSRSIENNTQASQIVKLAQIIDSLVPNFPVVGSALFEYSDEWRFVGSSSTQDPDSGWTCPSCFDGAANEDFWGVATDAATGDAKNRILKPSYYSLQQYWQGTQTTIAPTNSLPTPTSFTTPTATPTTINLPTPTVASSFSISGIKTVNKSTSSITLLWSTSIPTTALVIYGTNQNNLSSAISNSNFLTAHTINFTNLLQNTKYYYRIIATSAANTQQSSTIKNFTTAR